MRDPICPKIIKCKKCKKPFMAFTGLDIEPEKQPCPHCEKEDEKIEFVEV